MIKKTVRLLRSNQTETEAALWIYLRNRGLGGKKFVRQYPFQVQYFGRSTFVVVDFYCHAEKLAIEIDGSIHDDRQQLDKQRQEILEKMGIRIIRFKNKEIFDGITCVLDEIRRHFSTPLSFKRGAGGELQ